MDKGEKLLKLIRQKRQYETRTLDGYKPNYEMVNDIICIIAQKHQKLMYDLLTDEIELVEKDISNENKRKIKGRN